MKLQHIDKLNLVSFFVCTNRFKHRNFFALFFFDRRCISNSLSTHRMAYVANLFPYSGRKLSTAFISPIVPMEIRSSCSSSELTYFLRHGLPGACCATPILPLPLARHFLICTDSLFPLPVSGEPKMFSHSTFSNSFLIFYVSRRHSVLFPFIFFFRCQFLYAPDQAFPLIRNVSFQYLILYKCKCFLLPPHCQHQ